MKNVQNHLGSPCWKNAALQRPTPSATVRDNCCCYTTEDLQKVFGSGFTAQHRKSMFPDMTSHNLICVFMHWFLSLMLSKSCEVSTKLVNSFLWRILQVDTSLVSVPSRPIPVCSEEELTLSLALVWCGALPRAWFVTYIGKLYNGTELYLFLYVFISLFCFAQHGNFPFDCKQHSNGAL